MDFVQMEGLGNVFVVVAGPLNPEAADVARWCDRRWLWTRRSAGPAVTCIFLGVGGRLFFFAGGGSGGCFFLGGEGVGGRVLLFDAEAAGSLCLFFFSCRGAGGLDCGVSGRGEDSFFALRGLAVSVSL